MPENGRFSEREIEHGLRDLGARIEYPPTPDVARSVRRKLDEEEQPQEAHRTLRWPPFLAPRWTAVAAALVLISVVALSPALRATLSGLFVPQAGLDAGGSAAKPESAGSETHSRQGSEIAPQAAGAPAAGGQEAAASCPSPSIKAAPARAAAGAEFRLRGRFFSSGCDKATPSHSVKIFFRQEGETWKLATLDADRSPTFDVGLRVPAGAASGRATVFATTSAGEHATVGFVVLE